MLPLIAANTLKDIASTCLFANQFATSTLTKRMSIGNQSDNNPRKMELGISLENPWLHTNGADVLYHLGLDSKTHNLERLFGDVKFVCAGGTVSRMKRFAEILAAEAALCGGVTGGAQEVRDLTGHAGRYSMFKVGPVISVSHGIGGPSLSILLHELLKLLFHAKCTDVTFFRIGTCGGIGVSPGTVVVTSSAVDELLNSDLEVRSLGRVLKRPCSFDSRLVDQLIRLGEEQPFPVLSGTTLCTSDFYEGQGRLDGAFCDFASSQKMDYLRKLQNAGVKNIEMESLLFGAILHRARVRSAVVCVTLVDRLQEDQVVIDREEYLGWQDRPQQLVLDFIRQALADRQRC